MLIHLNNMSYKLYDINNKEVTHHDLQDKSKWCKDGEKIEEAFVRIYGEKLGLIINPEKKTNAFAPDLFNLNTKRRGDLKLQSTPFFKAKSLYGIDPTYAVVFNLKDKLRYEKEYPEIEIYYWINWIPIRFQMGGTEISVSPLDGVWRVDFNIFNEYLNSRSLHEYQQRVNDQKGNARSSFVCDIRNEIFQRAI